MKAMILAAGLGTRLRPLTDDCPKALVKIGGRTLLDITLSRLRAFGIRDVIVNVHHFADMIVEYLQANHDFGMRIAVSREEFLLDTGGGLKKAAYFFLERSDHTEQPFILHNVDVVSNIDFQCMLRFHTHNQALATLAVHNRQSSRYLLFDQQLQLCGRRQESDQQDELVRCSPQVRALAFAGVHIISPRLLTMMVEDGPFSIISSYLRLASEGVQILAFLADEYYWRDLGRPNDLVQVASDIKRYDLVY